VTALLHLDQVSARYGAVTAVHPLALTVEPGSRHAIIGPNGAGKTTLLHLIAGSLPVASGRILLADENITGHRPDRRARNGIARTFQHPAVITALTVVDNLRLALPGSRRGRPDTALTDALNRVGLTAHAHVLAGHLAYGQRRLLELGMALADRPRLLLLDEPSAGLDPAGVQQLTALLASLPEQTAVILVDHHLPLVWAVAETVTVLHHGRHLSTGKPADIRDHPGVRDAYLNPPNTTDPAERPLLRPRRPPILLEVRGLHAGYHGADVLHGIDLDLPSGAIHAVLGRNGAGKTTLLNALAGLHPVRAGRIRLDDVDLHAHRRSRSAAVAIVPQGRRLFAQLTVAEHLRLAAGRRPPGQLWDLGAVLDLMPSLRDGMNRPPGQLSGGQQQFLALARALLAGPRLLLLDEPTEGLAPSLITQLQHVLTRLADRGQTVLLAEQNLGFALQVANRLTVLEDGRTDPPTDLTAYDDLHARDELYIRLGVATRGAAR
jgi:ABC-type branched-subunit amino acid transport system ATPase component